MSSHSRLTYNKAFCFATLEAMEEEGTQDILLLFVMTTVDLIESGDVRVALCKKGPEATKLSIYWPVDARRLLAVNVPPQLQYPY